MQEAVGAIFNRKLESLPQKSMALARSLGVSKPLAVVTKGTSEAVDDVLAVWVTRWTEADAFPQINRGLLQIHVITKRLGPRVRGLFKGVKGDDEI